MIVLAEDMEVLVHCGVHGRVAVQLAEIAEKNNVELCIVSDGRQVSCSSILELLGLALVQGTWISVRVKGEEAEDALQAVRKLLMGDQTV